MNNNHEQKVYLQGTLKAIYEKLRAYRMEFCL